MITKNKKMQNSYLKFAEIIEKNNSFVVISHNRPDGDTLGANLALSEHLLRIGKTVTSACADQPSSNMMFLPGINKLKQTFLLEDYEVIIVVDTGAKHLVRFFEIYPELNRTKKPIICIDHHSSSSTFGTLNIIEPSETSTTTLLYKIFKELNWNITPSIATNLLNGIYTDTGSFKHANTKSENFKTASQLLKLGANISNISKYNFQTKSVSGLKLMGAALENLSLNEENVASTAIPEYLQKIYPTKNDALSGLSDLIASIKEANYGVVYTESKGEIKASLRTNKNVNVAKIAEQYGGGGHIKAAGYKTEGKLQKVTLWQVV